MGPGDRAAQLVFRGAELAFELHARVFDVLLSAGNPLLVIGESAFDTLPPWIVGRPPYWRRPDRRCAPDSHRSRTFLLLGLLVQPLAELLDPLFEMADGGVSHSLLVAAGFESLSVLAYPEPDSTPANEQGDS